MKNRRNSSLVVLASIFLFLIALELTLVSASSDDSILLCLKKGEKVRFSLCNPAMEDRTCLNNMGCQYCTYLKSSGVYCPSDINKCNSGGKQCTSLTGSSSDNGPLVVDINNNTNTNNNGNTNTNTNNNGNNNTNNNGNTNTNTNSNTDTSTNSNISTNTNVNVASSLGAKISIKNTDTNLDPIIAENNEKINQNSLIAKKIVTNGLPETSTSPTSIIFLIIMTVALIVELIVMFYLIRNLKERNKKKKRKVRDIIDDVEREF